MKQKQVLNFREVKFNKQVESRKGIIKEMKLVIKFSPEEAKGWKFFCSITKPDNMEEMDFARFVFFKGAELIKEKAEEKAKEFFEQHPELLTSGIDQIPGSPSLSSI